MEIGKWRSETGARNSPLNDRNAKNCRSETGARQPNPREYRGFSHTGEIIPGPDSIRTKNCSTVGIRSPTLNPGRAFFEGCGLPGYIVEASGALSPSYSGCKPSLGVGKNSPGTRRGFRAREARAREDFHVTSWMERERRIYLGKGKKPDSPLSKTDTTQGRPVRR